MTMTGEVTHVNVVAKLICLILPSTHIPRPSMNSMELIRVKEEEDPKKTLEYQ
jgi:hypothetical protein